MTDRDKLLDKIRKLLALATSPNEHEASLALEKAHALLAKHNLELRDLEDVATARPAVVEETFVDVLHPNTQRWQSVLLSGIARTFFCQLLIGVPARIGRKRAVYLIGRAHNVATTWELWQWIEPQLKRLAGAAARETGRRDAAFSSAFLYGAAVRVVQRLEKLQGVAETRALVVSYGAENDGFISEKYPRLRKRRHRPPLSGPGWQAGYDAGAGVSLHSARSQVQPGTRQLPTAGGGA